MDETWRSLGGSVALTGAIALAITSGCSSDEGDGSTASASSSDATSAGQGGSGSGPTTYATSECGTCVHEACRDAFDACLSDPECPAYAECLDACPLGPQGDADPACVAACPRGSGSESLRAAAKIDACRDPGPGAGCSGCGIAPRDGAGDVDFLNQTCASSDDPQACIACQIENCCETYDACAADPACAAYRECFKAAGDYTEECNQANPGGVALYAPDYACSVYHCAIDTPHCDRSEREPCWECAYANCTEEWAAFEGSQDGFLMANCLTKCAVGDETCDQACYDQYPDALDEAAAFGACTLVACGEEC